MIFEESTWADNVSAKKLEDLLFSFPHNLKNQSDTEKFHVQNTTDTIGKKSPISARNSKTAGNKSKAVKHKVSVSNPKTKNTKHTASKPTNRKIRFDERKPSVFTSKKSRTDKHHPQILESDPKLPATNHHSQKHTPYKIVITSETEHKSDNADNSKPNKSAWRKRAFSKLMQQSAFPRSRFDKRAGNETQFCTKDDAVHDAKRRKLKPGSSATQSMNPIKSRSLALNDAVTNKTMDRVVYNAKHRNVEHDRSATSNASLIESRSEALKRAVTSKLMGAQFRFINEQLYTRCSKDAKNLFAKDKKLFQVYHDGYSQQISRWPTNPLDAIINVIQKKPVNSVIGDFGCGDARIARSVKNKVHSFDLVACNDSVTIADIAHVPLPNESLDVAVLCLSLMGTNFVDFISEANRTLKVKGVLLIAEIESRFKNILKFKNLMKNMGFQLKSEEKNSYFLSFNFMKTRRPNKEFKTAAGLLKPCLYKKR